MIKPFKFKSAYCLMLTSALILAGCGGQSYNAGSSEDLLSAEGEWTLVEEKRSPSPMQKHMDTREQVSPTQLSKSQTYTDTKKSLHIDEDIHFRVLRLERQMDTVRSDLDMVMPKIAALPPKKIVTHKKKVVPVKKTVKPAMGGPQRVVGVRTGVHPGKVRLVLDMSNKPEFSYDLDNAEGLLLVELPRTGWDAAVQKKFAKNPIIASYSVQKADDGTSRLALELKKTVKIGMAQEFSPNHVHGHRAVFDLIAQ